LHVVAQKVEGTFKIDQFACPRKGTSTFQDLETTYWKATKTTQKALIIQKEIKQEENGDGNTSKLAKMRNKQGTYAN
jgi:hypothetical protein